MGARDPTTTQRLVTGRTRCVADYYGTITLGEDAIASIRGAFLKAAKNRNASAERMARRDRKRILQLEAERRRLFQAHRSGAVP